MTKKKRPKPKSKSDIPTMKLHKASGQSYVRLGGKIIYCGRFGTDEADERYRRVIREWKASGGKPASREELTIVELATAFHRHAQQYYRRPDGTLSYEPANFRNALAPVVELYGRMKVNEVGPLTLKAVRDSMIERGWCRSNINKMVSRVKHVFRWAAENELASAEVYHRLAVVSGLRMGRSEAKEGKGIQPVSDHIVDATLPYLTPTLRAMVELQLLTGMRSGELCLLRTYDVDTSGRVWVYKVPLHKTSHTGRDRLVFIGPRGQRILAPWLKPDLQAYVFSPKQSEAERRTAMHVERQTPLSCGNRPGTNKKDRPVKTPGERWTTDGYAKAIRSACRRAGIEPWRPYSLRHSYATMVRREHGLESAQVLLAARGETWC